MSGEEVSLGQLEELKKRMFKAVELMEEEVMIGFQKVLLEQDILLVMSFNIDRDVAEGIRWSLVHMSSDYSMIVYEPKIIWSEDDENIIQVELKAKIFDDKGNLVKEL